jgi:hypothetical protein
MTVSSATLKPPAKRLWPRPVLPPLPLTTTGVETPVISLNGTWKLTLRPPKAFWSNEISAASWADVQAPCAVASQGPAPVVGQEYAYRRAFTLPADWQGKRIFLRFDGVTGLARVWVNGAYLREHYGGYTTWYCDITDHVIAGQEAQLTLGVTDRSRDEISPFNVGGIIRDVRLLALPQSYVTRLHVETDLDGAYRDATLKVMAGMAVEPGKTARLALTLTDPQGQPVAIRPESISLSADAPEACVAIPVAAPNKWDAEHPNLYTLQAQVWVEGAVVETLSRQVGFRKIEAAGNRLLVNGMEVKLRGVNRHDVHPNTGRAVTPELVEQDLRLFREANINFIRTSHYPPREDFLDICDRYGIYVEDEIAVAFVHVTQNGPDWTSAYMHQFTEMIERDRSHPSIIMWSLANESYWGSNFQKQYDYVKAEEPSRPTIYSYQITMPEGNLSFELWSLHYAGWNCDTAEQTDNGSVSGSGAHEVPVLHDEYAHIPCYNIVEQMRDPGVREFYGESIKRFWDNIYTTPGALGGAIWGSVDDVIAGSQGYTHQREWGIIDGWRRPKPEYWLTKKAYSPIRIEDRPQANPGAGVPLRIAVENRFDHTHLSEIRLEWRVASESGVLQCPGIAPHSQGELTLPARAWQTGDVVSLRFYRMQDILVDAFDLPIGPVARALPQPKGPSPALAEEAAQITVSGASFELVWSKETGLITRGAYKGQEVITGGPYLNLIGGIVLPPWTLLEMRAERTEKEVVIHLRGRYGDIGVAFRVGIDGQGLITTTYTIEELPYRSPRVKRGLDAGGYREVGVAYTLASAIDRLSWERQGLWSVYPEDHLGRPRGTAPRLRIGGIEAYRVPPTWPWAMDMRNYSLFGRWDAGERGTEDWRSMKHNVLCATAGRADGAGVRVESDGSAAVRLEALPAPSAWVDDRDPAVRFVGTWVPLNGDPKSYQGTETASNKAGDYVEFTFQGTGVAWIGSKDVYHGKADVYLDGELRAAGVDLYGQHRRSRGEEKVHQQAFFCQEGLAPGEHTLRVVVTGDKSPESSNAYVSVDAFVLLGTGAQGDVRLNINNAWNYPELTWGNYMKEPVLIEQGYGNTVHMRLTDDKGNANSEGVSARATLACAALRSV